MLLKGRCIMKNITVSGTGKHSKEFISYYATKSTIMDDYDEYEKFIKGCEHAVRKDDRYTAYIAKLKQNGLNRCAVLGNLDGESGVSLEIHHGPIFNLFDYCDIVTRYMIATKEEKITTFQVAKRVLEEHEADHIMIVMLSKSPHKGGHFNLFIHIKSTFGLIDKFIDKYHLGMTAEHEDYIQRYIDQCKNCDNTVDNGLFETANRLRSFK